MTTEKKSHPLTGRKKSAASIRKRKETLARNRELREQGKLPPRASPTAKKLRKNAKRVETRTFEQLTRDVGEAIWCLNQSVKATRQGIAAGTVSLTDVTDEETYMYMAKRYLEGGLKP